MAAFSLHLLLPLLIIMLSPFQYSESRQLPDQLGKTIKASSSSSSTQVGGVDGAAPSQLFPPARFATPTPPTPGAGLGVGDSTLPNIPFFQDPMVPPVDNNSAPVVFPFPDMPSLPQFPPFPFIPATPLSSPLTPPIQHLQEADHTP